MRFRSSSELDQSAGGVPTLRCSCRIVSRRQRATGRHKRGQLAALCEDVEPPKDELDTIHYFCGNTEDQPIWKSVSQWNSALQRNGCSTRAYASIADKLSEAGYGDAEIQQIEKDIEFYTKLRDHDFDSQAVRLLTSSPTEADMRHLIDTYIKAEEPRPISELDNLGLVDLICEDRYCRCDRGEKPTPSRVVR